MLNNVVEHQKVVALIGTELELKKSGQIGVPERFLRKSRKVKQIESCIQRQSLRECQGEQCCRTSKSCSSHRDRARVEKVVKSGCLRGFFRKSRKVKQIEDCVQRQNFRDCHGEQCCQISKSCSSHRDRARVEKVVKSGCLRGFLRKSQKV